MNIELWSDYACPYCYIGKRHLEEALAQFEYRAEVNVVYKAFELYPDAPKEVYSTTQGRIEWKYGKSPEEAKRMIAHIEEAASRAGIDMNYADVQNTNTFDAHRLQKLAEQQGKGWEMNERLMKAYFIDNLPLARHENLLNLAEEIGLKRDDVRQMLDGAQYAEAVREDEQQAHAIGVRGVPFFVIDGKIVLSGASPIAQLTLALNQAWQAQSARLEGMICGADGCGMPNA